MINIEEKLNENIKEDKKVMNKTGKHFELENLIINSNQTINLFLDKCQNMIIMNIKNELNSKVTEAAISISGLASLTEYHMYEDNYHNHTEFNTDKEGSYKFNINLSKSHLIFIQTTCSTIFLTEEGWSDESIGEWNSETRTATLKKNVNDTIEIDIDNVVLDGNNYELYGINSGNAIFINEKNNITIKRMKISYFTNGVFAQRCFNIEIENSKINYNSNSGINLVNCYYNNIKRNVISKNSDDGINLIDCHYTEITDNELNNNRAGVLFEDSYNIEIIDNKLNGNRYSLMLVYCSDIKVDSNIITSSLDESVVLNYCLNSSVLNNYISESHYKGIEIYYSTLSKVENNMIYNNSFDGIILYESNLIKIKNNKIANNDFGIISYKSYGNNICENRINLNRTFGIFLQGECVSNKIINNKITDSYIGIILDSCHYNKIKKNSIENNRYYGVLIGGCSFNKIYNNNFIKNFNHAKDILGNNEFSVDKPYGGNYWDTWTEPDNNDDGFVDIPYSIEGGNEDKLPWTKADGWRDIK